jgi:predicted nuclease of predicted toxin-antitoxin system
MFAPATPDEIWLARAGREDWIVLTRDARIRYHALEKASLLQHQVRAFVLTGGNLRGEEMADAFVRALPKMDRTVREVPAPFIARVSSSGEVKVVEH